MEDVATASSSSAPAADDDLLSVVEWQAFLASYATGQLSSESTPPIPSIPLSHPQCPTPGPPKPWAYADAPLYSSTCISLDDARKIRDYYCENGYLPPPRAPLESARHACIDEYDLYSSKQLANIQAATEVIAAFFPGTVCTFSLFHDHIQKHFALAGSEDLIQRYQLEAGGRIPSEDSLCGHAVLHESTIFFVKDLKNDWRYINNPFTCAGFKSFIGSSVTLQLNPLNDGGPRIGIGTLNVCFVTDPLDDLSAAQRKVLLHVTRMLETQLRATWEGDQRTREGRARLVLCELIEDALVDVKTDAEGKDGMEVVATGVLKRVSDVLPETDSVMLYNIGAIREVSTTLMALISGWPLYR